MCLELAIKSLYKFLCLFDSLQYMTCSTFIGSCFSTSLFNLRSRNGRRTLCRRSTTSLFTLSWPSTIPEIGLQNQSLNSWWDWKTCGIKKCINDQSSIRSFCRGVTVNKIRRLELKFKSVCHLWDFQFLIKWASSKIKYFHFFRLKTFVSCYNKSTSRYAHMKEVRFQPTLPFIFALFCTKVSQYFKGRTPFKKLSFPVKHDTCWNYNEMEAPYSFFACQMCKQSNSHDGLSESHFIS